MSASGRACRYFWVVVMGVAHPVHHGSQVRAAGQQPGGVGVAEVVDADVEGDAGGFDGGAPDAGAEGVA